MWLINRIITRWRQICCVLLLACIAGAAIAPGLHIRRNAWTYSEGAHFRGDISNAFRWGQLADEHGLFRFYDDDQAANPEDDASPGDVQSDLRDRRIDYPPLRLAIAQTWYRWAHQKFPEATTWQDDYEFTSPLLWANTTAELASAALVYFVIRLWRMRDVGATALTSPWSRLLRLDLPAMLGAMLLWFNPAVIWDGHCWPQWDIWPVPFFLAALLLASLDWWMLAGICLAIGASLKGQILLGAPILILWPIFRGHFGSALKFISGFLLMMAIIALPWIHPGPVAICWIVMMIVAGAWLSPFSDRWRPKDWRINLGLIILALLLAWPWESTGVSFMLRLLALVTVAACSAWFLPKRLWLSWFFLLFAVSIFLTMPYFQAGSAWYRFGFVYGTEKFDFMVTGSGAYNIPRMMEVYRQWPRETTDLVDIPFTQISITFTWLTRIIYAIALVLCGFGAAMQDRRRDTRFLTAMVAPWLLFFLILTQMHGRYPIWAAAMGSLLAGVGMGMSLLGVIVSLIAWMGIVENQLLFTPLWSMTTLAQFRRLDPAVGFLLLLIAAIYLYTAVTPRARMMDG